MSRYKKFIVGILCFFTVGASSSASANPKYCFSLFYSVPKSIEANISPGNVQRMRSDVSSMEVNSNYTTLRLDSNPRISRLVEFLRSQAEVIEKTGYDPADFWRYPEIQSALKILGEYFGQLAAEMFPDSAGTIGTMTRFNKQSIDAHRDSAPTEQLVFIITIEGKIGTTILNLDYSLKENTGTNEITVLVGENVVGDRSPLHSGASNRLVLVHRRSFIERN